MSREDLIVYLTKFIGAIEQNWDLSEEEQEFICLHKKILSTLQHDRVYKVCNVEVCGSTPEEGGVKEYNTRYYSSLKAAKRELRRRAKKLARHPFVAQPDEVQELGIDRGVAPDLVQSVVTNADLQVPVPGRFKIYEIRMLQDGRILPIQFVLSSIRVTPAAVPEMAIKKEKPGAHNTKKQKRGIIIPFRRRPL